MEGKDNERRNNGVLEFSTDYRMSKSGASKQGEHLSDFTEKQKQLEQWGRLYK